MMSIKVIVLQLGLTAFYFLRLLIQFVIWDNNTFGMGVWCGIWYGMGFSYHIPCHRTIPGFTVCPLKQLKSRRNGLRVAAVNRQISDIAFVFI